MRRLPLQARAQAGAPLKDVVGGAEPQVGCQAKLGVHLLRWGGGQEGDGHLREEGGGGGGGGGGGRGGQAQPTHQAEVGAAAQFAPHARGQVSKMVQSWRNVIPYFHQLVNLDVGEHSAQSCMRSVRQGRGRPCTLCRWCAAMPCT